VLALRELYPANEANDLGIPVTRGSAMLSALLFVLCSDGDAARPFRGLL
jgi:hypothetical protein